MTTPEPNEWWIVEHPTTRERAIGHCVALKSGLAWELMDYFERPVMLDERTPIRQVPLLEGEAQVVKASIEANHSPERVAAAMQAVGRESMSTADCFALGALFVASGLASVRPQERAAYMAGVIALAQQTVEGSK